ncbi:saccharopine dehydrogenase family protein [Simiduia agarivorans]|uniref:Saccharopine dehydrogenase n=1 Tax=Simiduia agarivorans (strain DSM 21679 / JCM 13881 / BCRC 17597 / SA1) TaxID=1117647 RepID=K4KP03_SIMAS|nr:saccharopine dehydrogenase family protein [Simiduia agarivorans]AFV00910.1 saccharopine dehydrogenase [Simiduia agarivorans SA1 = DSM 21679]
MAKKNLLIIGAGGVANVVAHKCAQHNDRLGDIHIASRNIQRCESIIDSINRKQNLKQPGLLKAHAIDALDTNALITLINELGVSMVLNLGSAFVNQSVLHACIETGVAYLDTAIHEDPAKVCETPPWYANYEWKSKQACEAKGVTAILGAGFDPGVVNAYARLAADTLFDSLESIDILDVNAGSHGKYFATNFDPEINFREFTGQVWTWQNREWVSNQMFEVKLTRDFPVVGEQSLYLTGHDEIHSISQNLDVPNVRFWMGFGEHYINVFTVLKNLGLLSEQPVPTAEGQTVVPLKVVKAVLPDPSSLAPEYTGKTCIGDLIKGTKDGEPKEVFIYNICDHAENYAEVESQAISYTAGVPAAAAALLIADGTWDVGRMVNVEELPAEPFLKTLAELGLSTRIQDAEGDRALFA